MGNNICKSLETTFISSRELQCVEHKNNSVILEQFVGKACVISIDNINDSPTGWQTQTTANNTHSLNVDNGLGILNSAAFQNIRNSEILPILNTSENIENIHEAFSDEIKPNLSHYMCLMPTLITYKRKTNRNTSNNNKSQWILICWTPHMNKIFYVNTINCANTLQRNLRFSSELSTLLKNQHKWTESTEIEYVNACVYLL
eukprot:252295_1